MFLAGLRGRIAAIQKAEAANALMRAAENDMKTAIAVCNEAHLRGHPHIHNVGNRPPVLAVSEAHERAVIAGAGIELETGKYAWLDFVKSSEPD
jgi:hypothetical protein